MIPSVPRECSHCHQWSLTQDEISRTDEFICTQCLEIIQNHTEISLNLAQREVHLVTDADQNQLLYGGIACFCTALFVIIFMYSAPVAVQC